ncbi:MAG: CAP domain-containing protein [Crocinitomicaceae bacterium]|nr:CAP domain-containing protein [Crocinitomicaceae bacterium]
MKLVLLLSALFISGLLSAQTEDRFDLSTFNKQYLEHLVKTRIDAIRAKHDCEALVNDSILYVASDHHAQYMQRKKRITHNETDSVLTKTPQLRAEYFGAENYRVGENVLYVPYNSKVKSKKEKKFDTHTYQGIADAMVDSWVNSPGHFKNIITKDYQITGLSVSIDPIKERIYACQKFAKVDFKFRFEENKEFFNFSEYIPPPVISSFDGIPNQLIEHKYPFKLRHDKLEQCATCDAVEPEKPYLTLRIERNKFILKVENSEYVQKLIRDRKDGFTVEIVEYEDYMCGNPEYYMKPSRRNGQLKLNGFTLEPLYRKDLFKGYKKRKKKKDVRFLKYIFRKDSVSFFRRFGQYKSDKYSSQYFEITLGKVPKDIGYYAHNLVYIQNKQICDIDYFTSFCGELYSDYQESEFIPLKSKRAYEFYPIKEISNFTIPFEQGQVTFTDDDIEPFLSSIGKLKFNIDSIDIHAYASIEGDSIINGRLQQQRAQNIANLIQSRQAKPIKLSVLTSTDWLGFTTNASKSRRWKFLASKTSTELDEYLKKNDPTELEALLAPTRRGDIRIYATIPVAEENYPFLIQKENNRLLTELITEANTKKKDSLLGYIEALYEFAHYMVSSDSLAIEELVKFKFPEKSKSTFKLVQQFLLYGFEYEEEFSRRPDWKKRSNSDFDWLLKTVVNKKDFYPELLLQVARLRTEKFKLKPPSKQIQIQETFDIMSLLRNAYDVDSAFRKNIDQVNFDLNVMLLNNIFTQSADPLENGMDAAKSISQLYEYYIKHDELTDSIAIALAKCAVHYSEMYAAIGMLEPHAKSDSIVEYLMQLSWNHSSDEQWQDYYERLLALSYTMNIDTWCNMFMGDCKIPFQAFDHEELRNRFCEECMERSVFLQKLKDN